MKIYFAGSIRGGREDAKLYKKIIKYLENIGQVLTEHVGDQHLNSMGEKGGIDILIYNRDLEWLKEAWHLLMVMPTSLIKYAALDEETKEFFSHIQ